MVRALSFCMSLCLLALVTWADALQAKPALSQTCRDLLQRMERTMQEAARSPLQGAWAGSRGRDSLVLIFTQNVCAMGMNNEELYGIWNTRGNTLHLRLERDKVLNFTYSLRGDTLTLDGGIVLTRQSAVNRPTIPGFGNDIGRDSGLSGFGGGPRTPLEGTWESQTNQGTAKFVFTGQEYAFYLKGRRVESGTFHYKNGLLSYTITGGTGVGRSGEHRASLRGDTLSLTSSNGNTMRFVRR
ncbi:MAG: hypothetical protein J5803_02240 [Desulfovibrio sp.]|nr:hypothetical protein [Desulfovibrio sp.]